MLLTERYKDDIVGTFCCFDRLIFQGCLNPVGNTDGMTAFFHQKNMRIFDYPLYAEQWTKQIRDHIKKVAHDNAIVFEKQPNKKKRKESIVSTIIKKRGDHPGIVCIIPAMELCPTFKPWHDKNTHKTYFRHDQSKCMHYYFYFIHETLGLCYVRVPTWPPFRLHVYCNGHSWFASILEENTITYSLHDNLFTAIGDCDKAQSLADSLSVAKLHEFLESFAQTYCPVQSWFNAQYHWTIMQAEYAMDIIFKDRQKLSIVYDSLIRAAVHTVKPDHIATFLGRKLNGNYQGEAGNYFNTRIQGTCIRHSMGPAAIKMYDKLYALRIECTTNDVSFFKHFRTVNHANGTLSSKVAPMKKNIYSLPALMEKMKSANTRYLHFISDILDPTVGINKLNKLSTPVIDNNHPYKGFNMFDEKDDLILRSIARGDFLIGGFDNKNLRRFLGGYSPNKISRVLKRLRLHGLIRKIGKTYRYYITELGRQVILMGLKLKELVIIPGLAQCQHC